ncbi:MAG: pentapeptide repeat-containing protein [Methyloceanibacter sp.]
MARAAKPIFSPSCGLTRMTAGIASFVPGVARRGAARLRGARLRGARLRGARLRENAFAGFCRAALSGLAFIAGDDAIEGGWLAMGHRPS